MPPPKRSARRSPPKRATVYDEPTSFNTNEGLREDVEFLKKVYKVGTAGELYRLLIRLAVERHRFVGR